MKIDTIKRIGMCAVLLFVLFAVGFGAVVKHNAEIKPDETQNAEIETAKIQNVEATTTETLDTEAKTTEVYDTETADTETADAETSDLGNSDEKDSDSELQETNGPQYPILAKMPSDMYKYTDVGDKKSENEKYRYLNSLGLADGGSVVFASEESYLIFDTASGTYGFLSERGEIIAPFGYEEAYPFHEGTACVRVDDKFGYIGMDGETVLPFIYDRATPFSEGLAYFAIGDTYGFMDESGAPVFYLDCESVSSFHEGRAYIFKDGKYGYIDSTSTVVIEPSYDDATYFKNGVAIVRKGGFYGVIGPDGEEILPTVFEKVSNEDGAFLYGKKGQTVQCFDLSGNMILEGNFEWVRLMEGCFIYIGESGKFGMADDKGNVICKAVFDSIVKVPKQNLAVVRAGEQGEIIDFSDEAIVSFDCEWFGDVTESYVKIRRDGKSGVIDLGGNPVVETKYDSITLCEDGAMLLKKDGSTTLRNADGQQILSGYEVIRRLGNSYEIKASGQGGKSGYGFADLDGKIILEPIYYDVTLFHESPLIFGSDNIAVVGEKDQPNDSIVLTAPLEKDSLFEETFVNEVTPGSVFYQCANADTFFEEGFGDSSEQIDLQSLNAHKTRRRLYGNVDGSTHLYLSVESYDWMWYEDYYALLGEEAAKQETPSVYGNYLWGGYESSLWYDGQEQKFVQGRSWHYGGSGNFNGCELLKEKNGGISVTDSWVYAYDRYESVTTYTVNDKEATEEEYEAMLTRYRRLEILE